MSFVNEIKCPKLVRNNPLWNIALAYSNIVPNRLRPSSFFYFPYFLPVGPHCNVVHEALLKFIVGEHRESSSKEIKNQSLLKTTIKIFEKLWHNEFCLECYILLWANLMHLGAKACNSMRWTIYTVRGPSFALSATFWYDTIPIDPLVAHQSG